EEGVPIEHRWVTKAVENAQKKVEARNFDIRKNVLEYDDVMNMQRKSIYALRKNVLEGRYAVQPQEGANGKGKRNDDPPRQPAELAAPVVERIRGVLESMVRHFGVVREGVVLQPPYRDDAQPLPTLDQLESVSTEKLEREVYHYFGVRVELEPVASKPTEILDTLRQEVPRALAEQRERLLDLIDETIIGLIGQHCPEKINPDDWGHKELEDALTQAFNLSFSGLRKIGSREAMAERAFTDVERFLVKREEDMSQEMLLRVFRILYLEEIDKQWIDHLQAMDSLRDGIGLRGYGQKDPKLEYKKEGYDMFVEMMGFIQANVLSKLFRVQVQSEADAARLGQRRQRRTVEGRGAGPAPATSQQRAAAAAATAPSATRKAMQAASQAPQKVETVRREAPKVGRNDPCPCGSGKKYKKCHGAGQPEVPDHRG
ncbi:MAG: SEC-C domain-containing protein, partial [Deltaproteobacteria bacterium]|nr:SEC-C domain-containing protein [Deltaproteobacteria bacterium]